MKYTLLVDDKNLHLTIPKAVRLFAVGVGCLIFLLCGCTSGNSFVRTPEEKQTPLPYISIEDTNFVGSIEEDFYGHAYTIEDRWEDALLQNMVSTVELQYPIDTIEELNCYAWALYDISMETELFSPTLLPHGAEHFADGIWKFSFNESEYALSYYDGPEATFLISAVDGHVITLRTEPLYLSPSHSGGWEMYNASVELPTDARKPFARVTWLEEPYEDISYPWTTFSAENRSDDPRWQTIAAGIDAQYPLIEASQITGWAYEFCETAVDEGLFAQDIRPCFAAHHNDGIWQIIYDISPFGGDHEEVRMILLVSDADGHVIAVNP